MKQNISGTNRTVGLISQNIVYPGNYPNHQLIQKVFDVATTSSSPDWNGTKARAYQQADLIGGNGTYRGAGAVSTLHAMA